MQTPVFARKGLIASGIVLSLACGAASAGSLSGEIAVKLTLSDGCVINGSGGTDGASGLDFGTIDFGSQPTHFIAVDSMLTGAGGGSGITVQCSEGSQGGPVLSFDFGLQPDGQTRQLAYETSRVKYHLYTDAARTVELSAPISLPNDGALHTVEVFAKALGGDGLAAGAYTDSILVTLDF